MTRVAIVTGAASGIGLALSRALAGRGDTVVAADIDAVGAERAARDLTAAGPGHTIAAEVDVRDADAVASLVSRTAAREGRLDLMVNNAGVAVGGEVHELTLDHWDRVIDVNLRGVVHGVHAAYPLMVEQGHGHIVNTASLAGLIASPLLTPYTATKHAVVGLSLALRAEAAAYGVGVTAVCPGFVDTPILDGGPADLPPTRLSSRSREMANRFAMGRLFSPDRLAQDVLAGVERNRALVVAPAQARLAWRLNRLAPRLVTAFTTRQIVNWIRQLDPAWPVERADGLAHG